MLNPDSAELILGLDKALLSTTLDQLRTFLIVSEKRSESKAATALGRRVRSVKQQVKAIQKRVKKLVGEEPLILPGTKGAEIILTHSGRALQAHAEHMLLQLSEAKRALTRPRLIHVGLTSYMTRNKFIEGIFREVSRKFKRDKLAVRLVLSHVSSDAIETKLKNRLVDFVFGGHILQPDGSHKLDPAISFLEFHLERVGLVCNYDLPGQPKHITAQKLQEQLDRFIAPTHGVFQEALERFLSPEESRQLIAMQSGNSHFGFDLLASRVRDACMLVSDAEVSMALSSGWKRRFKPLQPPVFISAGFYSTKDAAECSYQDPVYETFKAVVQDNLPRHPRKHRLH